MGFAFRHLALSRDGQSIELVDRDAWLSQEWKAIDAEMRAIERTRREADSADLGTEWSELYARQTAIQSPRQRAAFDAAMLAQGALCLFTGYYSFAPYYFPDNFELLSWSEEFFRSSDDGVVLLNPVKATVEIHRIAESLLRPFDDLPPLPFDSLSAFETLLSEGVPESDIKSKTQFFAVQAILDAEGALRALADDDGMSAACWMSDAYMRLIDAANAVEETANRSSRQRQAAARRHAENYANRDMVLEWYRANHATYRSIDAAAEAAIRLRLIPDTTFRTIRDWISKERKRLRSTGKP